MTPDDQRVMWMVWASLLVSQLIVAVVGQVADIGGSTEELSWAPVAGMAVLPACLSVVFGRQIAPEIHPKVGYLVRWAGGEAVGLIGLVVIGAGGPPSVGLAMQVVGLMLTAAQAPRG